MNSDPTVFEQHAQEYDQWYDAHELVYQAEIAALQKFVAPMGLGIEVGVGTGRFAMPLGLRFGIDPSRRMLQIARSRGLCACQAVGERLPFRDGQLDLVLLVTVICFVEEVARWERCVARCATPLRPADEEFHTFRLISDLIAPKPDDLSGCQALP